jgi:hypothetical protein
VRCFVCPFRNAERESVRTPVKAMASEAIFVFSSRIGLSRNLLDAEA